MLKYGMHQELRGLLYLLGVSMIYYFHRSWFNQLKNTVLQEIGEVWTVKEYIVHLLCSTLLQHKVEPLVVYGAGIAGLSADYANRSQKWNMKNECTSHLFTSDTL